MKRVDKEGDEFDEMILDGFLEDQFIGVIPEEEKDSDDEEELDGEDNLAIMFEVDLRVLLSGVVVQELELLRLEGVLVEGPLL
jgi:hypothetical protein